MKKATLLVLALLLGAVPASFAASTATKIATVAATTTTFTDATVVDGVTYVYYVTAVDGESLPSNTSYATIPAAGSHSVVLTWTLSVSPGIQSQNIYRAIAPNPPTNVTNMVN